MTNKINTELFIQKANEVHGIFYDYSQSIYINYRTKLKIICPIHGLFEQRIDHHLNGHKCKACGCNSTSQKVLITKEDFLERAISVHGNLYDYSLFKPCRAKEKLEIICKDHGIFKQNYDNHINQKNKCPKCSQINGNNKKRKTLTNFIKEANSTHNCFYTYEKSIYISDRIKLIITCPIHGDFEQTPNNHLQNKGCTDCVKDINVFHREGFKNASKGRECTFYIIKCFNNNEKFYKIGITSKSIKQRYSGTHSMPYDYTIIKELKGTADDIWIKEKEFKNKYKTYLYTPDIKFGGSKTECFNENAISLEFP